MSQEVLIATLGTEPQVVTLALDLLEQKGHTIAGVIVLHTADKALRPALARLREEFAVSFLREKGELTFLGRAQMFRLPYASSPLDLVPARLCRPDDSTDLAEAIFGYVTARGRTTGRAGRVYFTDAVCERNQGSVWLSEKPITPQILAGPKPTTFQHYLVQNKTKGHDPDDKRKLAHYGTPTPDETVIRGHKLYWHKEADLTVEDFLETNDIDWNTDTQHTQIRPVRKEVTFLFRVYFENLTDVELGALLWVLNLPDGHHHKVGMGKPLGLGSVAIKPHLVLTNLPSRYQRLFDAQGWHRGERIEAKWEQFRQAFEQYVLGHMSKEERGNAESLAELTRIRMLLKMLEWPGPKAGTGYMSLDAFRGSPVLPDPLNIDAPPSQEQSPSQRRTSGHQRNAGQSKRRGRR